jgi:hypothetical protein
MDLVFYLGNRGKIRGVKGNLGKQNGEKIWSTEDDEKKSADDQRRSHFRSVTESDGEKKNRKEKSAVNAGKGAQNCQPRGNSNNLMKKKDIGRKEKTSSELRSRVKRAIERKRS